MANCRRLLMICLSLASLHTFMEPAYCNFGTSQPHPLRNGNWEKVSLELKGSSFRKLKAIDENNGKPLALTVAKVAGPGVFTTVQQAINSVPVNNKNPVVINIKPGIYREKLTIPAEKPFISLIGTDAKNTVITWNDSSKSKGGSYYSATVSVYASDFIARKITIQNSYRPGNLVKSDPAVAVRISADRCAFYECRFLAYQDTVLDESGRHYFQNCFIEGAVDVICGNGKSVYQNCELHAITINIGAFTAQKRSSPSEDSGFIFLQCKLTGKGLMFLGRAWGPYSRVLFANSFMDDIIFPEGWGDWNDPLRQKTVDYGQYQCEGPGARSDKRVPWSHVFTDRTHIGQFLGIGYIDGNNWIK